MKRQLPVVAVLITGCSPQGVEPEETSESGRVVVDYAACKTVSTTSIDEQAAHELGFAVHEELPLFGQTMRVPFHRGNLDCSKALPRMDGHIEVVATLRGIYHQKSEPTLPEFAEVCTPDNRDAIVYDAEIQVTTDDGTLLGTFPAKGHSQRVGSKTYASVLLDAEVEPGMVVGSLGIRADVGRPHEASVWLRRSVHAPCKAAC